MVDNSTFQANRDGTSDSSGQTRPTGSTPTEQNSFKVSTGLKDLIGRGLITNDFVAVFELVKNSFDAHASVVRLSFDNDRIVVLGQR